MQGELLTLLQGYEYGVNDQGVDAGGVTFIWYENNTVKESIRVWMHGFFLPFDVKT